MARSSIMAHPSLFALHAAYAQIAAFASSLRTGRFVASLTFAVVAIATVNVTNFSSAAQAETAPSSTQTEITRATLLSDATQVTPGSTFWVAVHLDTKDDWHTYWENPGDSGLASEIAWTLPAHITAGPIHFLPPTHLSVAGLYNYGYEGETYLLAPLTIDAAATAGNITLRAEADWLVCKEVCIPEHASLALPLAIGNSTIASADAAALSAARAGLPKPYATIGTYQLSSDDKQATPAHLTLRIALPEAASSAKQAQFFPLENGVILNDMQQKVQIENGTLSLTAARGDAALPAAFHGVLALRDASAAAEANAQSNTKASFWFITTTADGQPVAEPTAQAETKAESNIAPEITAAQAALDSATASSAPMDLMTALLFALLGGLILNLMPCVLPILSLKALALAQTSKHSPGMARWHGVTYTLGVLLSFAVIGGVLLLLKEGGAALGWGYQLQSPLFVAVLMGLMLLIALNLSGVFELPVIFGNSGGGLASRQDGLGSFITGVLATLVATPCTGPFMGVALGYTLTQPLGSAMAVFLSLGFGLALPYLLISLIPATARMLPKPGAWMLTFKQLLAFPMYATAAWLLWVLSQLTGSSGLALGLSLVLLLALSAWGLEQLRRRPSVGWLLLLAVAVAALLYGGSMVATLDAEKPARATPATSDTASTESGAQAYSPDTLNALRAAGKPVFVYATADWCITCKVNERVALSDADVKAAIARADITVLVADWTHRDAEITRFLASFERRGVPLYVFYPAHGEPVILPQLLSPATVIETLTR